jgi:cytochrome c peroxidase
LPALQVYQLALVAPTPPAGSFDAAGAARGKDVFNGPGKCASCHVPPMYTEPGWNLHPATEIGIDDFQSSRSPTMQYRTTPLRGLYTRSKGGFYHDGRFATLADVVNHYDMTFNLNLAASDQSDLVEYLKSL